MNWNWNFMAQAYQQMYPQMPFTYSYQERNVTAENTIPEKHYISVLNQMASCVESNEQKLATILRQSQQMTEDYVKLREERDKLKETLNALYLEVVTAKAARVLPSPTSTGLSFEGDNFVYALKLSCFPSMPLFSKKNFKISIRLTERNGANVDLSRALFCFIEICQMTEEMEEVTKTRKGKPILKGEIAKVFKDTHEMAFDKLMFNDISGYSPQGRFNMFIRCANEPEIKPLLVEGVRVKARKKRPEELF